MTEIPDNENTYNVELVPLAPDETGEGDGTGTNAGGGSGSSNADNQSNYVPYSSYRVSSYDDVVIKSLSSPEFNIPKVQYTINKKVLSLDVETTGLNPWDYRLIVCSVWDLDEPKSNMVTFASWDEEQLCKDMFEYINNKHPDVILAFNAKFECRCFITRAMYYHIQAPWIWSVEWHDMLTMLEGGWKNGLSGTMPAGSEENWLKFFFNEVKPYNIEECFKGIREGRLDEMIIRNRTCVQGQGDMYQLFMYCQSQGNVVVPDEKPSASRIDDVVEQGLLTVKCEVCSAVNEVTTPQNPGQCWRCSANLPQLTNDNVLREVARPIDWTLVGLSGDKLKTAQAAAKKSNAEIVLQPVGTDNIPQTAIKRLSDLGIAP